MRFLLLVLTVVSLLSCSQPIDTFSASTSPINLSHALSLVDSLSIDGQSIAFIYIYADAPDYNPIEAEEEGVACVDDAGRFMEVLEHEILNYNNRDLLPVARAVTRFLLYMSRDDGLWYNFILADGQINTTHLNSVADFGWWAIRGLRGLAASYNVFKNRPEDTLLFERVKARIATADRHIQNTVQLYPTQVQTSLGERPAWLVKNAPDMNSELLIALTKLHRTGDFDYLGFIQRISEGIVEYQYAVPDHRLQGMYLCWNNIWHNWGNNQAYGLLEFYRITSDSTLLASVRLWADSFAPFLIESDFPRKITVNSNRDYVISGFPQIAYGINSIYRGMKSLAEITGNDVYSQRSDEVFKWFKGQNIAHTQIYQPETGRCFDGIDNSDSVNINAGAESTIECLLAIQMRGFF